MTSPDRRQERRALERGVADLAGEVGMLRAALDQRPTATELAFRRRRLGVLVALFSVMLISAHDEHVERCAPGARAEAAIEVLLRDQVPGPMLREEIVRVLEGREQPKVCDVTFPLHDHDGNGWPRPFNLLGFIVYGFAALSAVVFVRWPLKRDE